MHNYDSLTEEITPDEFFLSQNYPNPFRDKTIIKYCIPYKTKVQISIYNSRSEIIAKLVNEEKDPGTYETEFHLAKYSGTVNEDNKYYYRLEAGDYYNEKKMICLV
jgi:hypothetical protein